jgi:hypothetical protein
VTGILLPPSLHLLFPSSSFTSPKKLYPISQPVNLLSDHQRTHLHHSSTEEVLGGHL